ncbi:hypothetical protein [Helicobacter bizzozeronii]|uniref:hypothetical protein n=1 Tax=Helicobacter bizzozeronii TaxID=56877 RepID=UPI000CED9CDF|nr:hypothetical protein [Helicobacter bizzozeronii]
MANKATEKAQETQVNVNAVNFGNYTSIWIGFNDGNNAIPISLEKFTKWFLKKDKKGADIVRGSETGDKNRTFTALQFAKGKENTLEFRCVRATNKEEAYKLLRKAEPIHIKLSTQTLNELETLCKITKKFGKLDTKGFNDLYIHTQQKPTEQENDTIELEEGEDN